MTTHCDKCGRLWRDCDCDVTEPDDPIEPSPAGPAVDPVLPFGKYMGQRASSVDEIRYLDWMVGIAREPFRALLLAHLKGRPDWAALDE